MKDNKKILKNLNFWNFYIYKKIYKGFFKIFLNSLSFLKMFKIFEYIFIIYKKNHNLP